MSSDKNPEQATVDEWVAEEQWHVENATVDMSIMLQGVEPGQQIGDTTLYRLDGESVSLASLWSVKPLLIISGSMTCPPSRMLNAQVNELAERYPQLNVINLYVIDAHPDGELDGDLCPYTGTDWLGKDNKEANVRHAQPKTLDERRSLASHYRDTLGITADVLLDDMENGLWEALGRLPNSAVLLDTDGKCLFCQQWFMSDDIHALIAEHLP